MAVVGYQFSSGGPGTLPRAVRETGAGDGALTASAQPCRGTPRASAHPVRFGLRAAERQAVPRRAIGARPDGSACRVEDAVEEPALDADRAVEPLRVPQVGHGRRGLGVQVGRAVTGDLQPGGLCQGRDAQPDREAAAADQTGGLLTVFTRILEEPESCPQVGSRIVHLLGAACHGRRHATHHTTAPARWQGVEPYVSRQP